MKLSFVSTNSISSALRLSLQRMQSDLVKAETEVSTGKVYDKGLALGAMAGRSVSLTRDVTRMETIVDANSMISGRLTSTQDAIKQVSDLATTLLSTLTASASGSATGSVLQNDGEATLRAMTSILNSSLNGEFLFAGINTDVQPLTNYQDAGAPNKAAFDAAFLAHFGFTQNDAGAALISETDMKTFMDTVVQPQFLGAGWAANWSSATDQRITARIAINETAQTSVSANEEGFRKLAMAATMVSDLFAGTIGPGAREALITEAVRLTSSAIADLADVSAELGITQQRVKSASERLDMQITIFTKGIGDLESIDPYEASTRITALLTQIETSYALTARIQQLSLVRFLP